MTAPIDIATTTIDLSDSDALHELVRTRYAEAATRTASGACCAEDCCADDAGVFGPELYSALERDELPDAAVLASLGCGNPIAVADLHEGERVLDLGSGGGIDVLLSARRVGPTGRAIGLDMTDEMLALAQRNAAEAGATNVEFVRGHIEAIPLPAASVDVVISNCVINLAADKAAVFREIARVLRPGGRMGVSDVVADDALTADDRLARGSFTGQDVRAQEVGQAGRVQLMAPERGGLHRGSPVVHRVSRRTRGGRPHGCVHHAYPRGGRRHGQRHRQGPQAGGRRGRARVDRTLTHPSAVDRGARRARVNHLLRRRLLLMT